MGENTDHFVFYSNDTLRTNLRIRVSYQATRNFVITIHLDYRPNEILPYEVALEVESNSIIAHVMGIDNSFEVFDRWKRYIGH